MKRWQKANSENGWNNWKSWNSWNSWKKAFWVLCAANGLVVLMLLVLMTVKVPSAPYIYMQELEPAESVMTISSTKADLNRMIEQFLKRYTDQEKIKYQVWIEEDIRLTGSVQVFRRDVGTQIHFDPVVMKNGDLLLKASSMRIGALPVPIHKVLGYIRTYYDLPEWVAIEPNEKQVLVHLSKMKEVGPFKARVTAFDPVADHFKFELYMPQE